MTAQQNPSTQPLREEEELQQSQTGQRHAAEEVRQDINQGRFMS